MESKSVILDEVPHISMQRAGPVEVSTYVIVVLGVKKRFTEKYMVTFNI